MHARPSNDIAPRRPASRSRRLRRSLAAALSFACVVAGFASSTPSHADPVASGLVEVARLPVFASLVEAKASGWLILSPKWRRGYQIIETTFGTTTVQSFDLDTLAPLRRFDLSGIPALGGYAAASAGSGSAAGEVVHAVDEEAGRVYLAMSDPSDLGRGVGATTLANWTPDTARPFKRVVAIDERALDRGDANFAASFGPPPSDRSVAENFWLQGMAVARDHVRTGQLGKLLFAFAQPGVAQGVFPGHAVTQWDVSAVPLRPHAQVRAVAATDAARADWEPTKTLGEKCARAPMTGTSTGASGYYQWGILPTKDAVYLACQVTLGSAQTVRIELDDEGRATAALPTVDLLSRPVGDVFVDREGRRLVFRVNTSGYGTSWWVYDAGIRRYTGSLSGPQTDGVPASSGINPRTGRMYVLVPDYVVGGSVPVRGGLQLSDTRIDPPPALKNVIPELAYPANRRIQVDTVRNRIFVQRGHPDVGNRIVYPSVALNATAPFEPYYRVFEDRVPPAVPQPDQDDAAFTTNVVEEPGLTTASHQLGGGGYGSRVVLTGGPRAAASVRDDLEGLLLDPPSGAARPYRPPCVDENDRETVAGQVATASVSDFGAAATATGIHADPVTKAAVEEPKARCWPTPADMVRKTFDDNTGRREPGYKFDRDGDGADDFATGCVDQEKPSGASRDGYSATVVCDRAAARVTAMATGALMSPAFLAGNAPAGNKELAGAPAPGVTVGYAYSDITLERRPSGGVIARGEAIARDIAIGDTLRIGVVRLEASAFAAGTRGSAGTTFTRTICGVELFGAPFSTGCLTPKGMTDLEAAFRDRFAGQAEVRFRPVDPKLFAGTPSGYQAAVQRDRLDRFGDQVVNRDTSLAIPGMEVIFYRGDSPKNGPGRQIYQFAGVQLNASYGIVCLYGEAKKGGCHTEPSNDVDTDDDFDEGDDDGEGDTDGAVAAADAPGGGSISGERAASVRSGRGGRGIVDRILGLPADVARLLFSNPREFGLLAAVWALLYAPCYLGERRRSLRRVATNRIPVGGVV